MNIQTDGQTHIQTDRRTFWLIESPEGQCFEKIYICMYMNSHVMLRYKWLSAKCSMNEWNFSYTYPPPHKYKELKYRVLEKLYRLYRFWWECTGLDRNLCVVSCHLSITWPKPYVSDQLKTVSCTFLFVFSELTISIYSTVTLDVDSPVLRLFQLGSVTGKTHK